MISGVCHVVKPFGVLQRKCNRSGWSRRPCVVQAADPNPASQAQMPEAMAKALQDPETRKALEEQMKSPAVQAQMSQMAAAMNNPVLQERLKALQEDPEFSGMFQEIQKGGMAALMKYWDDPATLQKLGAKLGNVPMAAAAAAAPPPSMVPVEPEINSLFDAAKYGDLEAAEDFVAVGKDVNMQDAEKRTPLHYATAHDHAHVLRYLMEQGANLELTDAKGNTPLHYATGYGRVDIVEILLDGGASVTAVNSTGKTPAALARLNPRNPVLDVPDLINRLDQA